MEGINNIFVINLKRRKDRWNRFKRELSKNTKLSIDDMTRVEAVDGKELLLTKEIEHLLRNNNYKGRRGVLGCALSHIGIWKKIVDRPGRFMILEDDVFFHDGFHGKWNSNFPEDCGVCFLHLPHNIVKKDLRAGHKYNTDITRKHHNMKLGPEPFVLNMMGQGAVGYVITDKAASNLLNCINKKGIYVAIDHVICKYYEKQNKIKDSTEIGRASCRERV